MTQGKGELQRIVARTQQRDRLGVVDRCTNAVALVPPCLGNTQQSLGACCIVFRLGIGSGLLIQALGFGGLTTAARLRRLLQTAT